MKNIVLFFLVSCLWGGLHDGVFAQSEPPHDFYDKDLDREQIIKKIQQIKTKKITEKLNLTKKQADVLFPMLKDYEDKERELLQAKKKNYERLLHLSELEDSDEEKIQKTLSRLQEVESDLLGLRKKMINETKSVLSTRQVGKLVVFQKHFHRRMKKIAKEIKANRVKKGGRGLKRPKF